MGGEGRDMNAAAYSADGLRFAAGGQDGVTRVWSRAAARPVAVLRGQRSRVLDLGFGRTEDRVVSAAEDGTVGIWDAGRAQSWANSSMTIRRRLQPRRPQHRSPGAMTASSGSGIRRPERFRRSGTGRRSSPAIRASPPPRTRC